MNFAKLTTLVGIALLIVAWFSAEPIPEQADQDYARLLRVTDGHIDQRAAFADVYRQMSAHRRLLQNFYVGAAGLVCLGAGLNGLTRQKNKPAESTSPNAQ